MKDNYMLNIQLTRSHNTKICEKGIICMPNSLRPVIAVKVRLSFNFAELNFRGLLKFKFRGKNFRGCAQ